MAIVLTIGLSGYSANITINDGVGIGTSGWWAISYENNEVEPNTVSGQEWDMERFDLTSTTLTITSGFNITNPNGYGGFKPGDLFIDVNGGGYDFVAVIGNSLSTFKVYTLGTTYDVFYAQNAAANPWRYKNGGALVEANKSISYSSYSDAEGLHYTASLDWTWLTSYVVGGTTVKLHTTMECGNDNLLGQYIVPDNRNVVPEGSVMLPASMCLGIIGVVMYRRRYSNK